MRRVLVRSLCIATSAITARGLPAPAACAALLEPKTSGCDSVPGTAPQTPWLKAPPRT